MEKYNGKLNHTVNNSNRSTNARALWDARGSSLHSQILLLPASYWEGKEEPCDIPEVGRGGRAHVHARPHDGKGSLGHIKWQAKMSRWETPDQGGTSPCPHHTASAPESPLSLE